MRILIFILISIFSLSAQKELILILGHSGTEEYAQIFDQAQQLYAEKSKKGNITLTIFGEKEHGNKKAFLEHLKTLPKDGHQPLWVVLLGHGNSFEGSTNFHLRGEDLSHLEFKLSFRSFGRPIILIHTGTGSAPFLFEFSGKNRVSISATSSDQEEDFTRLHLEFAKALANPEADLDGDQQTSLFESFLVASKAVQDSYANDQMIPSEDALIDDNGDGLGTNIDWFDGLNPTTLPERGELDGLRAHQIYFIPSPEEQNYSQDFIHHRNELELKLQKLILQKSNYREEDYLQLLDNRIHQLAQIYISDNIISAPENGLPEYQEVRFEKMENQNVSPPEPNTVKNDDLADYDNFMNQKDLKQLQQDYEEILHETELIHYDWLNSYVYDSRASHFLERIGAFWKQYRVSLDAEACYRLRGQGLLHLKAFPELEELNLSYCPINDLDMSYIRYYELRKLSLKGTRITDLSFEILKHISTITHLDISETQISDACSNYLKNFPLETLNLSQTKISSRSLRNISSCGNLQSLDLDQTGIAYEDLIHLKGFENLKKLNIPHLKLSESQFRNLLKTLPQLKKLAIDQELLSEELKLQYQEILSL